MKSNRWFCECDNLSTDVLNAQEASDLSLRGNVERWKGLFEIQSAVGVAA